MDPRKYPPVSLKSNTEWLNDRNSILTEFKNLLSQTEQNGMTISEFAYQITGKLLEYEHADVWVQEVFDLASHLETFTDNEVAPDHAEFQQLKTLITKGF